MRYGFFKTIYNVYTSTYYDIYIYMCVYEYTREPMRDNNSPPGCANLSPFSWGSARFAFRRAPSRAGVELFLILIFVGFIVVEFICTYIHILYSVVVVVTPVNPPPKKPLHAPRARGIYIRIFGLCWNLWSFFPSRSPIFPSPRERSDA